MLPSMNGFSPCLPPSLTLFSRKAIPTASQIVPWSQRNSIMEITIEGRERERVQRSGKKEEAIAIEKSWMRLAGKQD